MVTEERLVKDVFYNMALLAAEDYSNVFLGFSSGEMLELYVSLRGVADGARSIYLVKFSPVLFRPLGKEVSVAAEKLRYLKGGDVVDATVEVKSIAATNEWARFLESLFASDMSIVFEVAEADVVASWAGVNRMRVSDVNVVGNPFAGRARRLKSLVEKAGDHSWLYFEGKDACKIIADGGSCRLIASLFGDDWRSGSEVGYFGFDLLPDVLKTQIASIAREESTIAAAARRAYVRMEMYPVTMKAKYKHRKEQDKD